MANPCIAELVESAVHVARADGRVGNTAVFGAVGANAFAGTKVATTAGGDKGEAEKQDKGLGGGNKACGHHFGFS